MCLTNERHETRDEKKVLMRAMDDYVESRVVAALKLRGIKDKCSECGQEKPS